MIVRTLALLLFLLPALAVAETPLAVLIPLDVQRDVERFAAGRDLLTIDDFSGADSRRDVVEVVLLYQALYRGGYRGPIREMLAPEASYDRIGEILRQGRAALTANSVWREAVERYDRDIWLTEPLLTEGQFVVGLYTRADHRATLARQIPQHLSELSAVSSRHWLVDWHVLSQLGLKHLYDRVVWSDMVALVDSGEADFALAPFKAHFAAYQLGDVELVPVPGVVVSLPGTRHWVASQHHPEGKAGFAALERGLALLRAEGKLERAYRQSGFFAEGIANWYDLRRPEIEAELASSARRSE